MSFADKLRQEAADNKGVVVNHLQFKRRLKIGDAAYEKLRRIELVGDTTKAGAAGVVGAVGAWATWVGSLGTFGKAAFVLGLAAPPGWILGVGLAALSWPLQGCGWRTGAARK